MGLENLNRYMQKKNVTRPSFTPHRRINSKWNKDLNVRLETIKFLEANTGSKISDISCSNSLSDILPQARKTNKK